MATANGRAAFIVITEDPQQDRGKRLSQVRSHLAKERHRSRRGNDRLGVHSNGSSDSQDFRTPTPESALSLIPEIPVRHKSPPLASSATGYRRMQKCEHLTVIGNVRIVSMKGFCTDQGSYAPIRTLRSTGPSVLLPRHIRSDIPYSSYEYKDSERIGMG